MTALRRAFLAVVPPPEVLRWTEAVAASARRPDDGLRWTRAGERHLTLQFLGRVDDAEALAGAVAAAVRRVEPFTLALGGVGAFPSARRASVLWLGITAGADELGALATAVMAATARHGVAGDERPFRPHLTLARSTRSRDLRALVERSWTGPAGPSFTVAEVVLFESDTRRDGAVHTERARFALAARWSAHPAPGSPVNVEAVGPAPEETPGSEERA